MIQHFIVQFSFRNLRNTFENVVRERERERERERWVTGEVADGDGDAGDGDEAEVVEGVEVSNDSGERRVPI